MNQEIFDEIYKIWKSAKPNERVWSNELAIRFGYHSSEALRSAFKRARARMEPTPEKAKKIFEEIEKNKDDNLERKVVTEIHQDGSITSERIIAIENDDLKNPEVMLKLHGFDVNLWTLTHCKNNYWMMQSKNSEDGRITLYQSKISCRPKVKPEINKDAIRKIFNSLISEYEFPVFKPKNHVLSDDGDLLIFGLADFHYALKAEKSTSNNEYNPQIAEKVFNYIIEDVIEKVSSRKIEKIIFWNGGDFFNCDNVKGNTTFGTPQDNAINYFDMVRNASKILIKGIDKLSAIAPVEYICSISNHDLHTIFMLSLILDAWYRNNENIKINTNSLDRYYTKYGNSLLGFCHDLDTRKAHKVMSEEAGNLWNSPFRYYFLGHTHHETVISDGSVEIRRLSTPSANSAWSYGEAYIGNIRKCQSFIINRRWGLTDALNTVIET